MIECIFTIDYEIYGNGRGALRDLIHEPAQRLMEVFRKWNVRFVPFVEVAELEMIEAAESDDAIDLVTNQIREFHSDGFEIGLHLHPQWYNAQLEGGRWVLDFSEYNLCTLDRKRIQTIVSRGIGYLRRILGDSSFVPLSFRAGNWLFQPTAVAADVLAASGIQVDSSVFKGGLQRNHRLDYRPAARNGYYWRFGSDVCVEKPRGEMLEVPIYTEMVPVWRMYSEKRVGLQQKGTSSLRTAKQKARRLLDFFRIRYPRKFDFCRMTLAELTSMMERIIREDKDDSDLYRPVVAIGHTKDLIDLDTVEAFLEYLQRKRVKVATFESVIKHCSSDLPAVAREPASPC
jgi:hypothetical protein